jgi:hypothetical protein
MKLLANDASLLRLQLCGTIRADCSAASASKTRKTSFFEKSRLLKNRISKTKIDIDKSLRQKFLNLVSFILRPKSALYMASSLNDSFSPAKTPILRKDFDAQRACGAAKRAIAEILIFPYAPKNSPSNATKISSIRLSRVEIFFLA